MGIITKTAIEERDHSLRCSRSEGSEGEDGECGDGSEYGGSNIASRSRCRRTGAGYAVSAIDSHCDAPGDA